MNAIARSIVSIVPETMQDQLPVVVIGAGPVGLAAAAHLAVRQVPFLVLERGDGPAAAMRQWAHVTIFSPWRFNVDRAARALLEPTGWQIAAERLERDPTAHELIEDYLKPLAAHPSIAPFVRYGATVTGVARQDMDLLPDRGRAERPFEVVAQMAGGEQRFSARAVIDASGTWYSPNPAGANGLAAPGERDCVERIAYGLPDVCGRERRRYAGRRVLVVGGGHSAMDATLDLARLKQEVPSTRILWAMRNEPSARTFGGEDADQLASRGALGSRARRLLTSGTVEMLAPFRTSGFKLDGDAIAVTGSTGLSTVRVVVDEVIVATGFRPDVSWLSEVRLDLDPVVQAPRILAPLIDPNVHSCGDVPPHGHRELRQPEPDFYMVGMKSYGRAPTFLMATGYEQVRSVVAAIAGDQAAADDVQLVLPATGVCQGIGHDTGTACCGGPAVDKATACCPSDAAAKQAGAAACGCKEVTSVAVCC
jgi:cation diffusion facilitator CzcD-associated flavoprotein CzcO